MPLEMFFPGTDQQRYRLRSEEDVDHTPRFWVAVAILAQVKGLSSAQADRRAMSELQSHDELVCACIAHVTTSGPAPKQKCLLIETAGNMYEKLRPGMEGRLMDRSLKHAEVWESIHPIKRVLPLGGMTVQEAYPILRGWMAGCTLTPEGEAEQFIADMNAAQ